MRSSHQPPRRTPTDRHGRFFDGGGQVSSPRVNPCVNPQISAGGRKDFKKLTIQTIYTRARCRSPLSQRSRMPIFLPISRDSAVLLRSTSTENLSPDKVWPGYIARPPARAARRRLQLFIGAWLAEWFPVAAAKVQQQACRWICHFL